MHSRISRNPHAAVPRRRIFAAVAAYAATPLLFLAGCQESVPEYREFRRVHEKVTQRELEQFLRVAKSLPDARAPEPSALRPPPEWSRDRTLPVNELLNEERKLLERGWNVEWLAQRSKNNAPLQAALRREKMTAEQFAGLTLAIGAAWSRRQLADERQLDAVAKRARLVIAELDRDERTFAKLSQDARHTVLRKAAWLTRLDRTKRLRDVPPENLALVAEFAEELPATLPVEFQIDPLESIADRLEERGVPFEEREASGFDDEITWNREDAAIGTDRPDSTEQ